MSGATAIVRHTPTGARPGRTWLDSVKDEAITFLKGDNNAPWAILAETVLGCVPILGQVIDARDVIKGLAQVATAPQSPMAWFNLVTAIIGIVPGGGDVVKRSARAIKAGTLSIDDLLAVLRKYYKGDPEKLIRELVDPGKITAKLDEVLASPQLRKLVSADVAKQIDGIRGEIGKHAAAFKKEIDDWLTKGRKTSGETGPAGKTASGSPPAKPETQVKEGTKTKGEHSDSATATTPNTSELRTQAFKQLGTKAMGVLGEHMADFLCQDEKGWQAEGKARHDLGEINIAKMNDGGRLVQLWPLVARGRGIDAVWYTKRKARPYAIVEAKASVDPTRSLESLLGDAADKTESSNAKGAADSNGSETSRAGKRGSSKQPMAGRQADGRVTQMSHDWISLRLQAAILGRNLASDPDSIIAQKQVLEDIRRRARAAYTRHVLFFSVPHVTNHAEALILLQAGSRLDASFHDDHRASREWLDADIEAVVKSRANPKSGSSTAKKPSPQRR